MKNEKLKKKKKNYDNQDDSPKNKPVMGKIGVDRSEELKKITEEENDLENSNRKKNWNESKTVEQRKPRTVK